MIKEWKWNWQSTGEDGVSLYEDHLVWWSENWSAPFVSTAGEQTLEEYLERGPMDSNIPPEMLEELTSAVRELIAKDQTSTPSS